MVFLHRRDNLAFYATRNKKITQQDQLKSKIVMICFEFSQLGGIYVYRKNYRRDERGL